MRISVENWCKKVEWSQGFVGVGVKSSEARSASVSKCSRIAFRVVKCEDAWNYADLDATERLAFGDGLRVRWMRLRVLTSLHPLHAMPYPRQPRRAVSRGARRAGITTGEPGATRPCLAYLNHLHAGVRGLLRVGQRIPSTAVHV